MDDVAPDYQQRSQSQSPFAFPYCLTVYALLPVIIIIALMFITGRPLTILGISLLVCIPSSLALLILLRIFQGHDASPRFIAEQLLMGFGPAGFLAGAILVGFYILFGFILFLFLPIDALSRNEIKPSDIVRSIPSWFFMVTVILMSFVIFPVPIEFAKLMVSYRALGRLSRKGVAFAGAVGALGLVTLFQAIGLSALFFAKSKAYPWNMYRNLPTTGFVNLVLSTFYRYFGQTATGFLLGASVGRGSAEVWRAFLLAVLFQGLSQFVPSLPYLLFHDLKKLDFKLSLLGTFLAHACKIAVLVALIIVCKRLLNKIEEEDGFVALSEREGDTQA